ncbi:MAG: hypothetical protein ACOYB2_10990 [Limnohabitans sp.]
MDGDPLHVDEDERVVGEYGSSIELTVAPKAAEKFPWQFAIEVWLFCIALGVIAGGFLAAIVNHWFVG